MHYHLIVKFGDQVLPLDITNLRELTIVQDINKFLPEFRLHISDNAGAFTHIGPFGKDLSSVYIEIGTSEASIYKNSFEFSVFDRTPVGDQSNPSAEYIIDGLLDMPKMFSPSYCRAHSTTLSAAIQQIASELGVDSSQISNSLNYNKTVLQPNWSNVQLLKWLKENVVGKEDMYGFKCFVKREDMRSVLVFKSTPELLRQEISYKFIVESEQQEDQFPIFNYEIFDYYKLNTLFASKKQRYCYFDYEKSEFITEEESLQDYASLTKYWLIDKGDSTDSVELQNLGRNNEFTEDFGGRVKASYSNRLMNMVKMWITTVGLPNLVPGQLIQVFFPHGVQAGNIGSYQYSGYWLVERVVHNLGDIFESKVLLTRNGIDTDRPTTLLMSTTGGRR